MADAPGLVLDMIRHTGRRRNNDILADLDTSTVMSGGTVEGTTVGRRSDRTGAVPGAAGVEGEKLRAEAERLRAEVVRLRARLARTEAATPSGGTAAANAARSARASATDAEVVRAVERYLSDLGYPSWDLRSLGFPDFPGISRLRGRVAAALNDRGVPAPRGGRWSARQVQRALARHALRGG